MKKFHNCVMMTILLSFITTSVQGEAFDEVDCEIAYMESTHCSHWSAYIPITIMVAAAIWLGINDRKHRHHHSKYSSTCYSHNTKYKSSSYYNYCKAKYIYHSH